MRNKLNVLLLLAGLLACTALAGQGLEPPVVKKTKEGKFLDQWIVFGPIPVKEQDSVRRDIIQNLLFSLIFTDTISIRPMGIGHSRYDWRAAEAENNGSLMLSKLYDTAAQLYCYALCIVESKDSTKKVIGFGSDDDAEIWHNGVLIHQVCRGRSIKPEDDIVPVQLVPGRNTFLVRVDNRGADWGFCFRFIDKATEAKARSLRQFDPQRRYAPVALANDAAVLQAHLADIHPGYSTYTSKTVIDARFLTLEKELALGDSLSIKEYLRKLLPVLALIKDKHTMLWPDEKYFINDYRYAPFELQLIGSRLFVSRLFDKRLARYQMSELLEINSIPAQEFLAGAERIIPRDGASQSFLAAGIANYGMLNLLCNLLLQNNDNIQLRIRTAAGREETLQLYNLSSCNARYAGIHEIQNAKPVSYRIDREAACCYLTLTSFWKQWLEKSGISYTKAFKAIFEELEYEHISTLVIDLRHNDGGNPEIAQELLSYLLPSETAYLSGLRINESFLQPMYLENNAIKELGGHTGLLKYFGKTWVYNRVFEHDGTQLKLKEKYLDNIGEISPSSHAFGGKLYVITSGNTADVASEFCSLLRKHTQAVFIGQETGGAQTGGCGGFFYPLRLPATGCRIWIPAIQAQLNTSAHRPGRGVLPDYPVDPSAPLNGAPDDPELTKVRELIRSAK